jgi:S-adenosylmethionine:tRNA ribosyltransferase-isomerase
MAKAMNVTGKTTWKCLVGNMKKWKDDEILSTFVGELSVAARIEARSHGLIEFTWNENVPFSELVSEIGKIPLPPYIKREVNDKDKERYQTVYSEASGAVAAPTAGLHFTDTILRQLTEGRGVKTDFLTLHVSAGTFLPIKDNDIDQHEMHSEQIYVTRENIESILNAERITAVGTTSMRTLETLYWYGVKLLENNDFTIDQRFPYQHEESNLPDRKTSIKRIAEMMDENQLSAIRGDTSIFIYTGYTFRMCDRLITNFHLPGSTLILLVAAFIGADWKKVYSEALENDYRFLSYGDSSLLIPG